MKCYWLSTPAYTVLMDVNDQGVITKTAPILRWSIGREFEQTRRALETAYGNDVETVEMRPESVPVSP
jgi:hypothetical protein